MIQVPFSHGLAQADICLLHPINSQGNLEDEVTAYSLI